MSLTMRSHYHGLCISTEVKQFRHSPVPFTTILNETTHTFSIAGEPTFFRIRYFAEDKPTDKHTLEVGNGTSASISGLRPGILYSFDLQAHNVHGQSDYSTVKVNTTAVSGS